MPDGHKPYLTAHAEGVQIYECTAVAGGHAWRLLAPRAVLTGENGKVLGSHYGGPRWEASDGSIVAAARAPGTAASIASITGLLVPVIAAAIGIAAAPVTATAVVCSSSVSRRRKTTAPAALTPGHACRKTHEERVVN